MERIESNWRIGNDWRIRYRYYLDGNELWFNYEDICNVFHIDSLDFARKYFKQIHDYNKRIFEDITSNTGRFDRAKFINKVAFDELSVCVFEHFNKLNNDMESLAVELGLKEFDNSYETKQLIGNLITELRKNNSDINKVKDYTEKLFMTPEIQDIVNTKYHSDKVREYNNWLNDGNPENNMFIAHKENNEIHTYTGPSIDEALDILYKASLE